MRVQLKTEGGLAHFPGLSAPVIIESSVLPDAEAQTLESLVEAVQFFALPAQFSASRRGAADVRHYTITIEDKGQSHTVRVVEPVDNPDMQRLLGYLQEQAQAQRRATRASATPKRSP